ncbi:MAG TPA: cytochrome b [Steroidobacter sp.]|nr:cytochrome b [Steroidobacter sp.]
MDISACLGAKPLVTTMQLKNDSVRYGAVAQLFHWVIVALIITQFFLANKADALPIGAAKLATLARHKSVGITILGLAILRLLWRLLGTAPAPPQTAARWQKVAARASHFMLYALLLVIPVLGWLMSSARNFPVSWFGLVTLPDLIEPNRAAYDFFHKAHQLAAGLLFVIALVHAGAALKHHFIDRDDVLRRMLPAWGQRGEQPPS